MHADINGAGTASVEQLSHDDEPIAVRLGFDLNVNLVMLSPVKHLPDMHSSRACSWRERLGKAVVYQVDCAAGHWRCCRQVSIYKLRLNCR